MNEYDQKLNELFDAMREQAYQPFFKGDASKAKNALQRHLDTMSRYIDRVFEHENAERMANANGGQELRDELERVNRMRTDAHNAAMDSLSTVNRIFEGYGLAPFISVEPDENRSSIGEKIAAYISVAFLDTEALSRSEAALLANETGVRHAERSKMLADKLDSMAAI